MSTIFKVCNSCISHSYFKDTVVLSYAGYGDSLKINEIALHLTASNINSIVFHKVGTNFFFKINQKIVKRHLLKLQSLTFSFYFVCLSMIIIVCMLVFLNPPQALDDAVN